MKMNSDKQVLNFQKTDEQDLTFVDALFGLITEPSQVTTRLLSKDRPPFLLSLAACLLLSIYTPIIAQIFKINFLHYRTDLILSLSLVFFFSVLFFVLLEAIFLRVVGVSIEVYHMFAAIIYSLTPLIVVIWLYYAINFFFDGRLTVITYLISGYSHIDDRFLKIFPFVHLIAKIYVLMLFFFCIKALGKMHSLTALMTSLLSIGPFYIANLLAVAIAEYAFPNTVNVFSNVFRNLKYTDINQLIAIFY